MASAVARVLGLLSAAVFALLVALTPPRGEPGTVMAILGPALLALASVVIAGLLLGTLRGLRHGSLPVPEPAPPLQVTSA